MNNIPIIYENEDIYIINKPSGLASQGGKGISHSVDVNLEKQIGEKIYLVHRLDKDTEGLLVVAKSPQAAHTWTSLISSKEVQKEYYALCSGLFEKKCGIINTDIDYKGEKKTALTKYSVEKIFTLSDQNQTLSKEKDFNFSLVRIQIETGRMHQIRRHLAQNGNPILADDKYGNFKINKMLKKMCGVKKLHLASCKLTIPSKYINNQTFTAKKSMEGQNISNLVTFSIPIPDYIQKTLEVLPQTY